MPGSPADFGKLIAEETEKWGNVVAAGIKSESTAVPESQGVIYGDRNQKKGSGYHTEEGHGE